ncbi:uncharacterized protein LOC144006813 [Festucalex cinctus]
MENAQGDDQEVCTVNWLLSSCERGGGNQPRHQRNKTKLRPMRGADFVWESRLRLASSSAEQNKAPRMGHDRSYVESGRLRQVLFNTVKGNNGSESIGYDTASQKRPRGANTHIPDRQGHRPPATAKNNETSALSSNQEVAWRLRVDGKPRSEDISSAKYSTPRLPSLPRHVFQVFHATPRQVCHAKSLHHATPSLCITPRQVSASRHAKSLHHATASLPSHPRQAKSSKSSTSRQVFQVIHVTPSLPSHPRHAKFSKSATPSLPSHPRHAKSSKLSTSRQVFQVSHAKSSKSSTSRQVFQVIHVTPSLPSHPRHAKSSKSSTSRQVFQVIHVTPSLPSQPRHAKSSKSATPSLPSHPRHAKSSKSSTPSLSFSPRQVHHALSAPVRHTSSSCQVYPRITQSIKSF